MRRPAESRTVRPRSRNRLRQRHAAANAETEGKLSGATGRALRILEFERVLEEIARGAATEPGRREVMALRPGRDAERIRGRLAAVEEAGGFLADHPHWSFPELPRVREPLRRLGLPGSVLTAPELAALGALLAAAAAALAVLSAAPPDGALAALARRIVADPGLESALARSVDREGRVLDEASPELRRLRGHLAGAHNRVVAHLESFLEGVDERHRVAGASVTIREGRYVIPLRREGKRTLGGYVHDESASGATVFIEPPSAIAMMNQVRALERAEAREVNRILRDLTGRCRSLVGPLQSSLRSLARFDLLLALARAARRWKAASPEIANGELVVRGGRHPLLLAVGTDAVPFDLALGKGERTLVVTGPNTGGKTVFLKSVGLIAALGQSGVVPPVGPGTRLPVFDAFFADVGDEQSIADSLSTFSAHLRNVRVILEEAGPDSLILIDEPGGGTDPAEGEALARAVVEALAERRALAIVTSHLGGLRRLARPGNGIVNASLHFDAERMQPTYRFATGRPGRSYGLAIARGLGFPESVLDRAEELRDDRETRVDELLASLEAKERAASLRLAELETARDRLAVRRTEVEGRAQELAKREREHLRRSRREARRFLLNARREVEAVIARLRAEAGAEGEGRAKAIRGARRRVEEEARALEADPEGDDRHRDGPGQERTGPLAEGSAVLVTDLGARGRVVGEQEGKLVVQVGGMRLRVDPSRIEAVGAGEEGGRRERGGGGAGGWTIPDPATEIDLRGQRADAAERSLQLALDAAAVADLRELRIIHGKGTGALRERVTAALGADARVASFRAGKPAEGGYGVTIARIGGRR